ncbi:Pkinase-domain-containing protein [Schizopora paradoxa]|uniref:Pkinase-domain-containing protein n=1 Tax=Schizopora paradoxa TaxID=27342 RepID=A0A0H2RS02_9AGAM|nr:Pkinase-domain-containing protein [Schizopora paradoxa]
MKPYARLDLIGKGGTSRVYRVMNPQNEVYALKKVSLDRTDSESIQCYMNEIALLKRLRGNHRIIHLIDSEVRNVTAGGRGQLFLVMECGEIDLARLIQEQIHRPMNMVWVAYYWQQILQAVQVIHDEKIVHSDLKPANFVLVKGQLKLIDFGIANAIANDTTNIQRDQTVGTVNYMSPEAIEMPEGMRRLKVGRPSDVWSLGCILYQMVYGHPPFQHLNMMQKMKAIPDPSYMIEYPSRAQRVPAPPSSSPSPETEEKKPKEEEKDLSRPVRKEMIVTMRKCLTRNPKDRVIIPDLLEEEWLAMKERKPKESLKLKEDETVINAFYMRQLLQWSRPSVSFKN